MTIVNLEVQTHSRLKRVKKEMRKANKPIYKINNNIVINHALKKVEVKQDYEISNTD